MSGLQTIFVDYNDRFRPTEHDHLLHASYELVERLGLKPGDLVQITDHDEHEDIAQIVVKDPATETVIVGILNTAEAADALASAPPSSAQKRDDASTVRIESLVLQQMDQ